MHGCIAELNALLEKVAGEVQDMAQVTVVSVGDMVAKGKKLCEKIARAVFAKLGFCLSGPSSP